MYLQSRNWKWLSVVLVACLFLIGTGCGASTSEVSDKASIVEEAKDRGVKHFKDKFQLDVVFTQSEVLDTSIADNVNLAGHVKGKADKKVSIIYNYKSWEVVDSIRPKE